MTLGLCEDIQCHEWHQSTLKLQNQTLKLAPICNAIEQSGFQIATLYLPQVFQWIYMWFNIRTLSSTGVSEACLATTFDSLVNQFWYKECILRTKQVVPNVGYYPIYQTYLTLPWQWSLITISQENHWFHYMFPTDHCRLVSIFSRNVRWRSSTYNRYLSFDVAFICCTLTFVSGA